MLEFSTLYIVFEMNRLINKDFVAIDKRFELVHSPRNTHSFRFLLCRIVNRFRNRSYKKKDFIAILDKCYLSTLSSLLPDRIKINPALIDNTSLYMKLSTGIQRLKLME